MILLSLLSMLTVALSSSADDILDMEYARYLGNRTYPNMVAYLGVPYAEPRSTRVTEAAAGQVVDAKEYAEPCIQGSTLHGDAGGAGSEDCLKLNIYVPLGAKPGDNLPTLVYFHGGGYIFGNPATYRFDHWIAQSPNFIAVNVAYRLSSLGWLSSPAFKEDANAGFQDQIMALKWIQAHIDKVGGDKKKVTISGESAGGEAVIMHLVSGESGKKGLFSGAIAQSVYRTPMPTNDLNMPMYEFFVNRTGCVSSTNNRTEEMDCLRNADLPSIARAQDAVDSPAFNGSRYKAFGPILDGKFVTGFPTHMLLKGEFPPMPLIAGSTTNDTLSFGTNLSDAMLSYYPSLTEKDIDTIIDAYPLSDFNDSEEWRYQTLTGELEFRCAVSPIKIFMASSLLSNREQRTFAGTAFNRTGEPTFTYRYNQRNPTMNASLGVGHEAENWMMFRGSNRELNGTAEFFPMTNDEKAFAEELIAYWVSFVRSGDPNTYKLARSPIWGRYSVDGERKRIVLQQTKNEAQGKSGSFIENEPEIETRRCFVIAKTDMSQRA
ncbi:Alpha/Beta hydrolase protein [Cyathus striatus]|nr:Alpha/Beta hydrolase protein [Cyathus striatus]